MIFLKNYMFDDFLCNIFLMILPLLELKPVLTAIAKHYLFTVII